MRPLELTLEGFTSFRNQAKINFEKLELFAITGPTGAGKSSLLDAMTLALYGKVARKTQPKELLSQGSLKLQVSLRFLVNQTEYLVFRSWSYRTKTPQVTFKLEKQINGDFQPFGEQKEAEINAIVEKVLGMNFETFTKVILLPQGQFDEFLKGKSADRRKILSSLVGYERIFENMCSQAGTRANIIKGEYNAIQEQLKNLDLSLDIELNSQRRDRSQFLAEELPRLHETVIKTQTALAAEKGLLQRLRDLANWQQQLEELNKETPKISELKQQLEQARVGDRLSATWTSVNSARHRYDKTRSDVEIAAKALVEKESAFKIQEDNFQKTQAYEAEITPQLKQREEALNAAKIYEEQHRKIQEEVKRLEKILIEKNQLITEADKAVKKAEAELNQKIQILTRANNELSQSSPGGTRLEQLNQVTPLLIKWQEIQKQVESDRTKLQQITQELDTAEFNYQSVILNFQKSEAECNQSRVALDTARQKNYAAALRALLHTGDDCLVCGGIYPEAHLLPQLESSGDIKTLEKRDRAAEQNRQKSTEAKTQAETTREHLKKQQTEYQKILAEKEAELEAETEQIVVILNTDKWEVKALEQERQSLHKSNTNYQTYFILKEKAEAEIKASELNLNFVKTKLLDTQTQHQDLTTEIDHKTTQTQEILDTISQLTGSDSYENLFQKLEEDKRDLKHRIQHENQCYQTARDEFRQAQQSDVKAKEDFDSASAEKERLEAEWHTSLLSANFTEQIFQQSKVPPELQKQWQHKIDDYNTNKIQLETNINRETDAIGDRTTNAEIIAQYEKSVADAGEQYKQAQDEYNDLKLLIAKAEEQREQVEKLQAQLSTKQQELEIYQILSKELKSDRFQDYILQHFERELVEQATVFLLELTEQRYALKYENKEYRVEDNWSCGETRRVQTLSGGETFATSLSLALALSEKLSRGAKLGSLFIDEGFGTLDAETLQSVSSILQSLGQQEKLVGVITHVPALGEELGTQIKVEKFPEGSRIIMA
ncbi:AAA family ATPase [Nostoc sp. KVJ3]|uniref:SbcC/MukB-like Walker B domain-containing protein n=1 Tax=Nostoc sp. KVJ3 TaxID=457945 RepID=UPI0022377161|nr:SMC family ATPase [Nostoc sp. KVJ3]MCW5319343.1 AAA family ATPase [Nostoc sp. KVJ3]